MTPGWLLDAAPVVAPIVAVALLVAAQRWLGRWPDLWRARREILPLVAKLGTGQFDDELEPLDNRTDVNLDALTEQVPEKTRLPLQSVEFAGTVDAPPSVIRDELRAMERVWPNNLASIQYDVASTSEGGPRLYEVGSYAFRPQGILGSWQIHIRLTPADNGRRTRLWAHRERSAWRHPVQHYRAEGWDSTEGVRWVASVFASDERYAPSEQASKLIGE